MKRYIEQAEIMTLFFRSYFLYTGIVFVKQKNDNHQAKIKAYKTLMKIFGKFSKEQKIDNTLLIREIKSYIVESQSPYVNAFVEVFEESVRFIYDNVLITKEEQRLLERYA